MLLLLAAVTIVEDPQSVSNAEIGDEVSFTCKMEGTDEPPSWNINGVDFYVSELPSNMFYHRYEYQLRVVVTTTLLNRSTFYCFYVEYSSGHFTRIRSRSATLFIVVNTVLPPNFLVNTIQLGEGKKPESALFQPHWSPEAHSKRAHNFKENGKQSVLIAAYFV